jgi:hypothetical protein
VRASEPGPRERPAPWFAPAGLVIGFAVSLCGIGGWIFAGPLLYAVRKLASSARRPRATTAVETPSSERSRNSRTSLSSSAVSAAAGAEPRGSSSRRAA